MVVCIEGGRLSISGISGGLWEGSEAVISFSSCGGFVWSGIGIVFSGRAVICDGGGGEVLSLSFSFGDSVVGVGRKSFSGLAVVSLVVFITADGGGLEKSFIEYQVIVGIEMSRMIPIAVKIYLTC